MTRVYLSSSCVATNDVVYAIQLLSTITSHIELSGGSRHQSGGRESCEKLRETLMLHYLLHNYFPPPPVDFVLNFADDSSSTRAFVRKAVTWIKALDVPYYSIHAGYKKNFNFKNELLVNGNGGFSVEGIGRNILWFKESFPEVPLAIENLYPNNANLDSCFATSVAEIEYILGLDPTILLLLDLGHLKISGHYLGFDFSDAVDFLFSRYPKRIRELHISENANVIDDHGLITPNSDQYRILSKHKHTIIRNGINVTIEARNAELLELRRSYDLIRSLFWEE